VSNGSRPDHAVGQEVALSTNLSSTLSPSYLLVILEDVALEVARLRCCASRPRWWKLTMIRCRRISLRQRNDGARSKECCLFTFIALTTISRQTR
jgi:hypothetical protein